VRVPGTLFAIKVAVIPERRHETYKIVSYGENIFLVNSQRYCHLVLDKNDNFVLKTYSKDFADICLEALERAAKIGAQPLQTNNKQSAPLLCGCGNEATNVLCDKCYSKVSHCS
jgi:hypothetical protein